MVFLLHVTTNCGEWYTLPERWAKFLADAKAELGDVFTQSAQVHEGWVGSNESKVETVAFDADDAASFSVW